MTQRLKVEYTCVYRREEFVVVGSARRARGPDAERATGPAAVPPVAAPSPARVFFMTQLSTDNAPTPHMFLCVRDP